jgi:hypothetical protein
VPRSLAILWLTAASLAVTPIVAHAAPPPPTPAAPVKPEPRRQTAYVISLAALDTSRASRDLDAALTRAAESKPPAVVLVIADQCPWRTDLLRDTLVRLKDLSVPLVVHLEAPRQSDATISLGPWLLALASAHAGTPAASLSIRVERDDDLRVLVAEKTDWDAVAHDLRDLIAPHLARRAWLEGASDALLWPRTPRWAWVDSRTGVGLRLAEGDKPAPALNQRLLPLSAASRPADPYPAFTVPAVALAGTAEPFRRADDWHALCKAASFKPPQSPDAAIEGTLAERAADAAHAHDEMSRLRKSIDESLDAAAKDPTNDEETPRHLAAADQSLARLAEILVTLEALLAETPEVLRTLPPGKTPTAGRPASQPARWRSLVQNHRDTADKLRARLADARKAAR